MKMLTPQAPGQLTLLSMLIAALCSPAALASDLVISQVYGAGGNAGAVYRNDFVELFNKGAEPVSLTGKSIQYASATGNSWAVTALGSMTLQPGQYFLLQGSSGSTSSTAPVLPAADASNNNLTMAAGAGKVVLTSNATPLTGTNPIGATVLDKVGYGSTANGSETAPTPTISATVAALRVNPCTDTDNNSTDFVTGTPAPRNSATALAPCGGVPPSRPVVTSCPATLSVRAGEAGSVVLSATDEDDLVTGAAITSNPVAGITLGPVSAASANGASASVSLQVGASAAPGTYPVVVNFTNNNNQQASCNVAVSVQGLNAVTMTIPQIQGPGATSPVNGSVQTAEGVLTLKVGSGFFLQDAAGDGNPATSDGIFVFMGTAPINAAVGERVRVTGTVTEFKPTTAPLAYTEFSNVTQLMVTGTGPSVAPVNIALGGDLETVEGMLVHIPATLTVNQTAHLGDRGELTLSVGRRETATNRYRPGTPEALALAAANRLNQILLDDGVFVTPATTPYLGQDGTVRAGDSVSGLTGAIDYGAGGDGYAYKLQPSVTPVFSRTNPRTAAPALGGGLRVASANVLNFFTTFRDGADAWGATGQGCTVGATTRASNCRGADNAEEFVRQRDKIVSELKALNADVVGLMEIQNNADIAVSYLVDQLNAAYGDITYAFVAKPADTGTDAIRVAMIYKPASLALVGGALSDGDAVNNRPPMAQTFRAANGARFSVIVNHLKSKGSCGTGADADLGDGQGCNNAARVEQSQRLLNYFVPQVVSSAGDPDVLIIGDMNAHGFEDPIHLLNQAGFVNELERFVRPVEIPYSYVFEGESGYLDHALSSSSLSPQVVSAAEWHVNADEPTVIDYNTDGKNAAARALYAPHAYRSSDHDPVIVALNLTPPFADSTASFSLARSGLTLNRVTGKYTGSITLTNTTGAPLNGPFQLVFNSLTAGVTLDNASGMRNGAPYISVNAATIAPGAKVTLPLTYSNPAKAAINYTTVIYSGTF